MVVVYGRRKPDIEEVKGIWPVAKFEDDKVCTLFIPKRRQGGDCQ